MPYAGRYLNRWDEEAKPAGEIDMQIFKQLSELDTKLGTAASERLYSYLLYTRRWDIIKVRLND